MKAISLWEPWASLVRCGAKTWETRHWSTRYRGDLLICAAKRGLDKRYLNHLLSRRDFRNALTPLAGRPPDMELGTWTYPGVKISDLHFGMAVAIVELTACRPTGNIGIGEVAAELPFGDFSAGRFGWKFEHLRVIEPFPVKGRQGIFNVKISGD